MARMSSMSFGIVIGFLLATVTKVYATNSDSAEKLPGKGPFVHEIRRKPLEVSTVALSAIMERKMSKPITDQISPAKRSALVGLTIGVALAAGRLASNATQESLGYGLSVVVGALAAAAAAAIGATIAQRLLFQKQ